MGRIRRLILPAALAFILTACGPTSTPQVDSDKVSTIVAGTMQTMATQPQATLEQQANNEVLIGHSHFAVSAVIPAELASGLDLEMQAISPPADDMPWWSIHPAYSEFPLDGYVLTGTFHAPKIYIYPIDEYAAMNEDVGRLVENLRGLIASPTQPLPERLPFLPTFNAAQIFYSNFSILTFQNGSGIRYLSQYGQAPMPINNHEMFYTFQGITSDGKYYVSAILPISIPFLVAYSSPEYPVPANGVPFDWDDFTNNQTHVDAVAQKLNAAAPEAFTPSLLLLDSFVQGVEIINNPFP